jgi:long-chain acyl-CoA synthetase
MRPMASSVLPLIHEIQAELTGPGGPFELVDAVIGGVPMQVYRHAPDNLQSVFAHSPFAASGRIAASLGDHELTFRQLYQQSGTLAGALRGTFGVGPGDRVAISMKNRPEWLIALHAIVRIGAVPVLVNSRGSGQEQRAAVEETGASVVFVDRQRAEILQQEVPDSPLIVVDNVARDRLPSATPLAGLLAMNVAEPEYHQSAADDPAVIIFTAGTTSRSKGAVLTQRNLCTVHMHLRLLTEQGIRLGTLSTGLSPEELERRMPVPNLLLMNPMFHVSALGAFLGTTISGGRLSFLHRWIPRDGLELIQRTRVTQVSGPPLVVHDLVSSPDFDRYDLASVTTVSVGGQATPYSLVQKVKARWPRVTVGTGWGMTETSGGISAAAGALFDERPRSAGAIVPGMQVRFVGPDGCDVPKGQPGEIWARGARVMAGYWNQPDVNRTVFRDGWYVTGDIGYLDEDDFIHICDRTKDIVISAGENIYCAEVEAALGTDPRIQEVAVFGVPDERRGERVVAAVILAPGKTATQEELQAIVLSHLADFKVPSEVVFDLGPFRRNAMSKVDKAQLRAAYADRERPRSAELEKPEE